MPEPSFEIEVRTRHGMLVRADVFLPSPGASGRYPVLLAASPYQKELRRLPACWTFPYVETGPIELYLSRGYAYVWMDVPGSGASEGDWDPVSRREGEAIHDAIEYVARQPWCTGKIGMIGQSYFCWSQWNAARTRPPHLSTIAPFDGATDMYRDWMYHGGLPAHGFLGAWVLASVMLAHQATGHDIYGANRHRFIADIYAHPFDDEWQRRRSPFWELDQVDIPVFSIGVWGKRALHLRGNVMGFERVRGPKQLLITHPNSWAGAQQLFASRDFHERELLPWYDHHLKGVANGVMERPAVRFFVNGEGEYRAAQSWPPPDVTPTSFYLSGRNSGAVRSLNDGSLIETTPAANGESTTWSYPDPRWVLGTTTFDSTGEMDHTAALLTYTSAPFACDREFTGHGVLVLHASSDQPDFDVIVRLSTLSAAPGGRPHVRIESQGWLRASRRIEDPALSTPMRPFFSHQRAEPVTPGQVYELRIELLPMSFLVRAGERLRLDISNNDSQVLDAPSTHWYGLKVGRDTYHHDATYPSRLILPERHRQARTS
ncbi:MAG TPA: CocE/NonD family hydrolase [Candidatus Binataceae bacterium]|nr:CocE/NonD family hydrolase [Candidatus Binataceae bacterium]